MLLRANLQNRGVNPVFFADKLHRASVSIRPSLRCDISGSFCPNWTSFGHDRDDVLSLVLLRANLQNKGVDPLLFADKLHRASVSRRLYLRYDISYSFRPNGPKF